MNKNDLREEKKVLAITSFAEFAERYSYYIIQSLLIFFLIGKFNISQELSASLVGTVLSMVYISAILGGYIAEKLIGYYRAGMLGSFFMVLGTFTLAISTDENLLFLGLSFISISTGLIKSNMASFIGRFYDKSSLTDGNRDFGFNVFYVGINLGSFFALFFATSLKDNYGYSAPFYSSMTVSIVMFFVLIIGFGFLKKHIIDLVLTGKIILKTTILILIYILLLFYIFKEPDVASFSIFIAFVASSIIMFLSANKGNYKKVLVAGVFFVLSIIYWGLYFQMFISLLLFTDYAVNTALINSSQILSIEALGVLIFGFIVGKLWLYLANAGREVQDIDKFNIAFIILALSFIVILISILTTPIGAKVTVYGFVVGYFILALSELSLSAIGLSLVTKIAPKGFVSLYMGIWLVTLGIGGKFGGYLAGFVYIPENDINLAKANMSDGMDMFIVIAIITSLLILTIRKRVNRNI
ncbi:peptide MFS transporter [Pseudofrancisella aestuarii]|uniref:Peptide MFS transporter n=1 Tax=Pseudofrancisella aestuarii TaxID=2670347 RepID=A0ABV9TAQ4_9GAMM|nr:peptide MFS transporter [Pseudofrancisella aestuarii]